MRKVLFGIACIVSQLVVAQLTLKPIIKSENQLPIKSHKTSDNKVIDPATLPFWDDFSISTDSVDRIRVWGNDTTLQWNAELSRNVYVNKTLAINPPTLGVVTFDGLDVNGGFNASPEPWADQLQSDTIDLQGRANVVLSFYWQAGGYVELPEEGDSLILQFYSPTIELNEGWRTVWSMDGGNLESDQDSVFTQVAVNVNSTFLTQDFVFRFQSFGDKDGPFDAWHLDYIYLNNNRGNEDFYYLDRGLTGQLTSPFAPFKSIPPNQFKANEAAFTSSQTVQGFNLDDQLQPTEYVLVIRDVNNANRVDSIEYGEEDPLFNNPDPLKVSINRVLTLDGLDLSQIPDEDSINLTSEVYLLSSDDDFLDGTPIDLRINDTIRAEYLLHNYYAYDDGTAEYAAGTNVNGGQVAVQFWLEESDTLTHIDIHFPSIDPISAGSALDLKIFKELDLDPIRVQNITVANEFGLNLFTRYALTTPLILSDTFYLGYEQNQNDYIGIGFDRSNPEAASYIYENKTGEWEQNTRLQGALMIRPVFAKVDSFVLAVPNRPEALKVYPNPTPGLVQIEGDYHSISLLDFSGRVLFREPAEIRHDFSNLRPGLYLLTIHRKEGDQTLKIIKK